MKATTSSPALNALTLAFLSSFAPSCSGQQLVPLTSVEDLPISRGSGGDVVPTRLHVADPWIRPPRGVATQQAIGMPGDFDGYPNVTATPFDRIKFVMRPILREGANTQRHGVYVITDKQLVRDYLDGKTEHPCGAAAWTDDDICQVVEHQGLNATDCPSRATLFPLLEIKGDGGTIEYTASGLGDLAAAHGVEGTNGGKVLAFDCPWVQGRKDDGTGRTSHCIEGMFLMVEVLDESAVVVKGEASGGSEGVVGSVLAMAFAATSALVMMSL